VADLIRYKEILKLISQATWWAERVADDFNRDENNLQATVHWI